MSISGVAEAPPEAAAARGGLPEASLVESVRVLRTGILPSLIRGLFAPRPGAMKLLTRLDTDRRAVEAVGKIRRKHGGEGARLLGGRIVVVWGREAIREVLDQSADVYASDAGAKAKGMAHFQPEALTLSRGDDWRDRRDFNESVLATSERVHPFGQRFVTLAEQEADGLGLSDRLEWTDWERLFDRIMLRVVFGDRAREDQELSGLLEKLLFEANRLPGPGGSDRYYEFYGRLERYLAKPEPDTLLARFAEAPQTDRTRVVQQIPHMMFATRDTLAANAYRALGAIVADPPVERRVREELEGVDLSDASAVDGLRYLEGCLEEAMRLWPTTPLIARETTRSTTLAGEQLDEGTQVILLNVFNHREPDEVSGADRLVPDRWADGGRDYRFNHLSNGTQDCPGVPLVHLLSKAVLARVLDRHRLTLEEPKLEPGEPLPHMLDFFRMRFRVG